MKFVIIFIQAMPKSIFGITPRPTKWIFTVFTNIEVNEPSGTTAAIT